MNPEDALPLVPPVPQENPEMEALLFQNDKHHQDTTGLLDTIIHQNDRNNPEPLLDTMIQQNEETKKS